MFCFEFSLKEKRLFVSFDKKIKFVDTYNQPLWNTIM